ncbi:hypothetical protein [Salinigranum salinum]|uniref:hypothetical protein n=1 Tax=Salinigranum salinum TaxID=1364937 RepID=UPI00126114B4|nr:hypothetical protein [Salinigranum salinum]
MMTRVSVAVVGLVLLGSATVGFAAPAPAYDIASPHAVDVPDRTVRLAGEAFPVSEMARVSRGDDLVVEASVPSEATYQVYVYDEDRHVVVTSDSLLRGDATVTFETKALPPGSYAVAIYDDAEVRAVLPLIVKGYAVSVDAPASSTTSAPVTIRARLTPESEPPSPTAVQLLVANATTDETVVTATMSEAASGYTSEIRIDDPGEYTVHVWVRGQRTVQGQRVLLGFSDPTPLSITETAVEPAEETGANELSLDPTERVTASPGDASATPSGDGERSTADSTGVITPNPTSSTSESTEGGQPFSVNMLLALFAVVFAVGGAVLHRRL